MSSILESVVWGKQALSLLEQLEKLDPTKPAVMHIRHSAREQKVHWHSTLSTEGKQAAYEFGLKSNSDNARIYHTIMERTKETANEIQKGIIDKGLRSKIEGTVNAISTYDVENQNRIMMEIMDEFKITGKFSSDEMVQFTELSSSPIKTMVLRWFSGQYSPLYRRPSLEFVQQLTGVMVNNLKTIQSDGLDIYVSHDTWIAALLFHWFGIIPAQWIRYLDGFIIQLYETKMQVFLPGETRKVNYPYWWNQD